MSYTIDGVMLTEAQAERIVAQVAERKRRPQPIPGQVYRHRKTTDNDPTGRGGYNVRKFEDGLWHYAATLTSGFYRSECADRSEGRYLWECGDLVPYTPPVISNATHAGRRVHVNQHPMEGDGIIVEAWVANRLHGYPDERVVIIMDGTGKYYAIRQGCVTLLD